VVFKLSADPARRDRWFTGVYNFNNNTFSPFGPQHTGLYDWGEYTFYASKAFRDTDTDRQVVLGRLNEGDSAQSQIRRGWAGVQSLPRVVTVNERERTLRFAPLPELKRLRTNNVGADHVKLDGDTAKIFVLEGAGGTLFEAVLRIGDYAQGSGVRFGFKFRMSPDEREVTALTLSEGKTGEVDTDRPGDDYRNLVLRSPKWAGAATAADARANINTDVLIVDEVDPQVCRHHCDLDSICMAWTFTPPPVNQSEAHCFLKSSLSRPTPHSGFVSGTKNLLEVDRSHSSVANDVDKRVLVAPLPTFEKFSDLRVFSDNSVVEVFAGDGRVALSFRIYPALEDSTDVVLFAEQGRVVVDRFDFWSMRNVNANPDPV